MLSDLDLPGRGQAGAPLFHLIITQDFRGTLCKPDLGGGPAPTPTPRTTCASGSQPCWDQVRGTGWGGPGHSRPPEEDRLSHVPSPPPPTSLGLFHEVKSPARSGDSSGQGRSRFLAFLASFFSREVTLPARRAWTHIPRMRCGQLPGRVAGAGCQEGAPGRGKSPGASKLLEDDWGTK